MTCPPLTVAEVRGALVALLSEHPHMASWPVSICDMHGDDTGPDEPWDALVTHMSTDQFTEKQGPVVLLMAWHDRDKPV